MSDKFMVAFILVMMVAVFLGGYWCGWNDALEPNSQVARARQTKEHP